MVRRLIAGTAGHIDHGKTALTRALTGIETDRLEEEQRRGISIDLGFAHLELEKDLQLGFIDVPGHERFVKNMLAGAGGIDLVLLVIAADESIKPQTREHFDICRLLGIQQGVIALTKADLVDPDMLELVRLEVEEFVAGSFLEGAPMVAVSAKTGAGLEELRAALAAAARRAEPKDSSRPLRLPVDRSFALRGFGTVVTGTLVSGRVAPEQEVEILPGERRARVRGVQVHGATVGCAYAGERTAVNLAGVEHSDIQRGMMLAPPGRYVPVRVVDARFDLLASAPSLKHRAPVHFHAGTAEVEARVRLLESLDPLQPGSSALVRFILEKPLPLLAGDRFIVRMFSPVVTIGGGVVLDNAPPVRRKRPFAVERLRELEPAPLGGRIALWVRESRCGLSPADLARRTPHSDAEIEAAAAGQPRLAAPGAPLWYLDAGWRDGLATAARQALAAYHRENPLQPGMPKEDLRGRVLPDAPPFVFEGVLAAARDIVLEGDAVRLASHRVQLKQDEEAALAKIESLFAAAGLAVPATSEVLAKSGLDPARARTVLQMLLRSRKLIPVSADLVYHASALAALREQLAARKGQRFSVPEFKDWTGVSRKYAIPLLEYLDRERVTRREGDQRVIV